MLFAFANWATTSRKLRRPLATNELGSTPNRPSESNRKDKENMKVYIDKIKEIDPTNKAVHDIEEAEKQPAQPKKTAPKGKK